MNNLGLPQVDWEVHLAITVEMTFLCWNVNLVGSLQWKMADEESFSDSLLCHFPCEVTVQSTLRNFVESWHRTKSWSGEVAHDNLHDVWPIVLGKVAEKPVTLKINTLLWSPFVNPATLTNIAMLTPHTSRIVELRYWMCLAARGARTARTVTH